jgi:uncharacterized membrane protein
MQWRNDQALAESRGFSVRAIPVLRPLGWLARGWRDLLRCPLPGLAHGLVVEVFGALLVALAGDRFWLLTGAFSGFLLVAPIVATGLYAVSRDLEQGGQPTLMTALRAWKPDNERLILFGLLLALAGTGWVLTSAGLVFGFAGAPVNTPMDFLRVVVLAPDGWLFEVWLMLGALLAAPMFASTVIAVPLLLDRPVSVLSAVLTSWRVVMTHPAPLALWAALLGLLTVLGLLTALGLIVIAPWLAHASWHAYRDLVDTRRLPAQP